jgi:hypothetical protein
VAHCRSKCTGSRVVMLLCQHLLPGMLPQVVLGTKPASDLQMLGLYSKSAAAGQQRKELDPSTLLTQPLSCICCRLSALTSTAHCECDCDRASGV